MSKTKSVSNVSEIVKKFENTDDSFGIGSVIRRTFANGSSIDNMNWTVLDDRTGKYITVKVIPIQAGYMSVVQLKQAIAFTAKTDAYSDSKVAFIKFKPKKGFTKESFLDLQYGD